VGKGCGEVGDGGGVKRGGGPGLAGESEFLVRNVDANDVRAESARNHYRRKADPSASIYRYPLAGPQPRLRRDAAKRRHEAAAESHGLDEFHFAGKAHEVDAGER